jgi:hypothetical protein
VGGGRREEKKIGERREKAQLSAMNKENKRATNPNQ